MLSTCPEACPRGRLSGCCSCGRPARLRVVARRDTPVPALSRGPVCVPRPSRVTWWFCLAPVPFVSASARWFTCACSRFFGHRCVCLSWPNLSRGSCVRAASVSSGLRTTTHLSRFSGLRARRACTRILLSLSLGGEGSRTPPPPRARACAKSLARESTPIVRAHRACHTRSREAIWRGGPRRRKSTVRAQHEHPPVHVAVYFGQ